MLGAIAALALGSLMAAAPASAYTINCSPVTSTTTTDYPYDGAVQRCGTAVAGSGTTTAAAIASYATGSAPDLFDEMKLFGAQFYVFKNPAEYDTYFTERGIAHATPGVDFGRGLFGLTQFYSDVPQWSVVFEYDVDGQYIAYFGSVNNTAKHETGHWADFLYKNLVASTTQYSSLSAMYDSLLTRDWAIVNSLTNCGSGGIFNGRRDLLNPNHWICTGAAHASLPLDPYYATPPGATNRAIMTVAYADRFVRSQEIFGNEVAVSVGSSDSAGAYTVTAYFDGARFVCTRYMVNKLIKTGKLPTATELQNIALPNQPTGSAMCPFSGAGWPTLPTQP